MKKVIRNSVFETNSSSSHSITISNAPLNSKLSIVNGMCIIHQGTFGWEQEDLNDPATKASYCYTYAQDSKPQMIMLRDMLEEEMGVPVKFDDNEGYIDHQSAKGENDACGAAFENKESLRQFIFCDKSILHLDNDNH